MLKKSPSIIDSGSSSCNLCKFLNDTFAFQVGTTNNLPVQLSSVSVECSSLIYVYAATLDSRPAEREEKELSTYAPHCATHESLRIHNLGKLMVIVVLIKIAIFFLSSRDEKMN